MSSQKVHFFLIIRRCPTMSWKKYSVISVFKYSCKIIWKRNKWLENKRRSLTGSALVTYFLSLRMLQKGLDIDIKFLELIWKLNGNHIYYAPTGFWYQDIFLTKFIVWLFIFLYFLLTISRNIHKLWTEY